MRRAFLDTIMSQVLRSSERLLRRVSFPLSSVLPAEVTGGKHVDLNRWAVLSHRAIGFRDTCHSTLYLNAIYWGDRTQPCSSLLPTEISRSSPQQRLKVSWANANRPRKSLVVASLQVSWYIDPATHIFGIDVSQHFVCEAVHNTAPWWGVWMSLAASYMPLRNAAIKHHVIFSFRFLSPFYRPSCDTMSYIYEVAHHVIWLFGRTSTKANLI